MPFSLVGNVTDLDFDLPRSTAFVVESHIPWTIDEGKVRITRADGVINDYGELVKRESGRRPGSVKTLWEIGAPEGLPLRLKLSSRSGGRPFLSVPFDAPADGTVLELRDLLAQNAPVPASSPTAEYVRGASAYELWLELPGNKGKTINQFFDSFRTQIYENVGTTSEELTAHILDPTPHPNYEPELPDLTVIFDNALL